MTELTAADGATNEDRDEERADWRVLGLSWLLYFAFSMATASLAPILGPVRHDLGLSYAQMGVVLGAWQLVYLVAALPIGVLLDRFNPRYVIFVGALFVTASQLGRSLAQDFLGLVIAVSLLGIGGPVVSVGLPKVIAETFSGRPRGIAAGVYTTGNHAGQVVVMAFTNLLIIHLVGSWRSVLQIYALGSFAIAVVWLLLARNVGRERPAAGGTAPVGLLDGIRHVARVSAIWPVVLIGFSGFLANHGFKNWLPALLESKGFSPSSAGLLAATPAVSGMVGSIVIVYFGARGHRRLTTVWLLLATGASVVLVGMASGPVLVTAVVVQGFCAAALLPLMMNTLMEMREIGPLYMGAAAGLYFSCGEIGGFSGPFAIGVLVGVTGSYMSGFLLLAAVMWLMLIPALRLPRD